MRLRTLDNHAVREMDAERSSVDAAGLARRLGREVDAEVRFDDASRQLYATDASNYRQVPIGVVIPRTVEAVEHTMAICREFDAPITSRGAATSLAGQTCNVAVIIDHSKYLREILSLDASAKRARVRAGVIHDEIDDRAKADNLTFAPDTATHAWATIGGMIGNNSCGPHSVMGGRTSDNVEELEVLTYEGLRLRVGPTSEGDFDRIIGEGGKRGELYAGLRRLRDTYAAEIRRRYPRIPRRVSGYNLDDLLPEKGCHIARALVGSEGTLVTVIEATLRLIHRPPHRALLVAGYEDVFTACDHVPRILECQPTALEGLDHLLIDFMTRRHMKPQDVAMLPEGHAFLMIEFGGETREEAERHARACMASIRRRGSAVGLKLFDDREAEHRLWELRESGLGATAHVPGMPENFEGWEDAAVPPERLGDYLREFRSLLERHGYTSVALYGHFGQGCVHCRIPFDLVTHNGIETYRRFIDAAADLVARYGGSLSGEHGDGQSKAALLEKMYGREIMRAHREFKRLWDPRGRMNPGKIVDPNPPTGQLRLGQNHAPWAPAPRLAMSQEGYTFTGAARRCVGVGKCRRIKDAFMCPSFLATRDEMDSTRGRARMLFEMLNSTEFEHSRSWRNPGVLRALDLCLGCKGCKADCPVKVDMAAYKSEFLSHYYGLLRPRAHYSMGLIDLWARLGSRLPGVANALAGAPLFGAISKFAAGVANQRPAPRFARESFTRAASRRQGDEPGGGGRVVLMPDLFHDAFHPEALWAAWRALRGLGYSVRLPRRRVPEARPLLHFGMIRLARRAMRIAIDTLRDDCRLDTPIVCLEPSTVSVFRDELTELFPGDEDAKRLARGVVTFSEFLDRERPPLPHLGGSALLHVHCHQKASLGAGACENVLKRMGVAARQPEKGCCGLAGAFGFERGHYAISMTIGERSLLPAARSAPADEPIVADGFSCRKQICDGAGRAALHLAEVVETALRRSASLDHWHNGRLVEPRMPDRAGAAKESTR